MLICWVIGTPTDQIFPIQIGSDSIWGVVKNAIKEDQKPEFDDIAAKTLKLWKVRHCAISHVVAQRSTPNSTGRRSLFPTFYLGIRRFLEERYSQGATRSDRIDLNGPQRPTS